MRATRTVERRIPRHVPPSTATTATVVATDAPTRTAPRTHTVHRTPIASPTTAVQCRHPRHHAMQGTGRTHTVPSLRAPMPTEHRMLCVPLRLGSLTSDQAVVLVRQQQRRQLWS